MILLLLIPAFLWLLIETDWLRVRLPRYFTPFARMLEMMLLGLSIVFIGIGLTILGEKERRSRTDSPIPPSLYNKSVWIKLNKTRRLMPFYCAVKIRQRFPECEIILKRKDGLDNARSNLS